MTRTVRVLGVAALVIAAVGCASGNARSVARTSHELAKQLDTAGLCVRTEPLRGRFVKQFKDVGVTGAWQCVGPEPTNGGSGGTEIATWAAQSISAKRRALSFVNSGFHHACAGPSGTAVTKSNDGSTTTHAAPPEVTMRYVEGGDWVAFVPINAPLRRVASALGGSAVAKHCG